MTVHQTGDTDAAALPADAGHELRLTNVSIVHVNNVTLDAVTGEAEFLTDDPQIYLTQDPRTRKWDYGALTIGFVTPDGQAVQPRLYLGGTEDEAVDLNSAGSEFTALLYRPGDLSMLRLDPAAAAGKVRITHVTLREVQKADLPLQHSDRPPHEGPPEQAAIAESVRLTKLRASGEGGLRLDGVRIAGLVNMTLDTGTGDAEFTSDDPQMHLEVERDFDGVVYAAFEVEMSTDGANLGSCLYLEEREEAVVPLLSDGSVARAIIVSPTDFLRLRFDPSNKAGQARIHNIAIRPASFTDLAARNAALATQPSPSTRQLAIDESRRIGAVRASGSGSQAMQGAVHATGHGRVAGIIWGNADVDHAPVVDLDVYGKIIAAGGGVLLVPGESGYRADVPGYRFEALFSEQVAPNGTLVSVRLREGPELEGSPFVASWPVAHPQTPIDIRRDASLRDAERRLVEGRAPVEIAGPLISILTPVYNVAEVWLRRMIDSVLRQTYQRWELCLVDDCSSKSHVRHVLDQYANRDSRIKIAFRAENGGISAATNDALAMASGDYIALLDNDDMLTCDALEAMVTAIVDNDEPDWLYSDEFKIDGSERASQLFAKPDWSPLFMLNYMYTGHLSLYKTDLIREIGGFRSAYDFSQDYDLALRVADCDPRVVHVDKYLYAWRMIEGSGAQGDKPTARISNIAALQDAAERRGWGGEAVPLPTANRLVRTHLIGNPKVSIIVPSDNEEFILATVNSIIDESTYQNIEIVVVTNSRIVDKLESTLDQRVIFARFDKVYNFSAKCNAGVEVASGEYVVFYNDDVRVITKDWIENILEISTLPGVGMVGPKLLYENNLIQHAGMVTGVRRLNGTAFHARPADTDVHFNMAQCVREVSLLCGALICMPTALFRQVGGFDSINAPINHSDVDLCFKVRAAGYSCVYTPHATLLHIGHVSLAVVDAEEKATKAFKKNKADVFLLQRWASYFERDPYFPPAMRDLLYLDSQEPFAVYAGAGSSAQEPAGQGDVLLISHDLTASGAPKVVYDMATAFRAAGRFVTVISPTDGPFRERLVNDGVPVIIDPLILEANNDALVVPKNYDLVIANTILCWRAVDALASFTDVYWYVHETSLISDFVRRFADFPATLIRPKGLWAGSPQSAAALKAHNCQPTVLEYGVDPGEVDITGKPDVRIAIFGSLEPRKGQDLAVHAMKLLPKEIRRRAALRIFGRTLDATFRNAIEAIARDIPEVEMSTDLHYERYREELEAADIIVVPSRDDTLPLVSLDALALGKPILCSMTTGTSYYLEHEVSALLMVHNSPSEIADCLGRLIESAELRHRIGAGGRAVYEAMFTVDAFRKRLFSQLN